jgi:arsenite methyltransferase
MGMVKETMTAERADYGIDAPTVVRNLTIGGMIGIIAGFVLYWMVVPIRPVAGAVLSIAGFVSGFCPLATAGLMVWSSKSGKLRQREHLIDALGLSGDELVLDVGCGRGLLLNGVARRLPSGKAFGIDLWQTVDQSGNSPETTLANSKAENVADRVEIRTADMRDLPFPDGTMDAVISSLAIHNVPDMEGRAKAIREIARVVKPNGRVALQDLRSTEEYAKTLTDLGWRDVRSSGLNFLIFPPVRIVTGRKP